MQNPDPVADAQPLTIEQWRLRAHAESYRLDTWLAEVIEKWAVPDPAWISLATPALLSAQAARLHAREGHTDLPLYGVPFAVKDNIDVAGFRTTAACPEFGYIAEVSASAVQRLVDAGGIVVGKTNLDQFATGLVGTRSPYGVVTNPFDARYVSGGSSSGSAVVVTRGQVPFALGTDTAGSGRVPAGFNNVVGLKPTKGWLSTRGVVPACRTLDCVSVFALTVADASLVARHAAGPDRDAYSRTPLAHLPAFPLQVKLGVPNDLEWFGDDAARNAYNASLGHAAKLGAELVPLDFSPFYEVAALLYQGPWVAERYAAIEKFIKVYSDRMNPTVRAIIEGGSRFSASELFQAQYKLAELKRTCDAVIGQVHALLVPTTPCHPSIASVLDNPIEVNSRLGRYTNFVNLLDWCAVALPGPFREDGLPAGVTLISPAWCDSALVRFGSQWENALAGTLGKTGRPVAATNRAELPSFSRGDSVRLAVVGAHLTGMPLNSQLTDRDAVRIQQTTTNAGYRLYALPGTVPPKPGLVRVPGGAPIAVEVWEMPLSNFGSFVAQVPAPLCIGTVQLADGSEVKGFLCEQSAVADAEDITHHGGWRAYMQSRA